MKTFNKSTVITAIQVVMKDLPHTGNLLAAVPHLPAKCTRDDIVYALEEIESEEYAEEVWCHCFSDPD